MRTFLCGIGQMPSAIYLILADPADRFAVGPFGFDRKAIERSRLSKDAPSICSDRS